MKTIIRLSENDLHRVIGDAVKRILMREGAYDKYAKDLEKIELDMLRHDDLGIRYAWTHLNDPLALRVKGQTLRHILAPEGTRTDIDTDPNAKNYEDESQDFITGEYLNKPNAARDFNAFPRYSRKDSGPKDYNNLSGGSERIRKYKQMKGI